MIDTRVFFAVLDETTLGHLNYWSPAFLHDEAVLREHGEGWVPVSHAMTPIGDGRALISIMCNREVESPSFDGIL